MECTEVLHLLVPCLSEQKFFQKCDVHRVIHGPHFDLIFFYYVSSNCSVDNSFLTFGQISLASIFIGPGFNLCSQGVLVGMLPYACVRDLILAPDGHSDSHSKKCFTNGIEIS